MKLLIYQDYIFNKGLLYNNLQHHYPQAQIAFCDAQDIVNGILSNDVSMLVIPGGADLNYCEKLTPEHIAAIRTYIENGGRYLGICAGAYFACNEIIWAGDNPKHEIKGPRPLKFSTAAATGPVYELIEDGNIDKSWMGIAPLAYKDNLIPFLYEGGPTFKNPNGTTLAHYETLPDKPPAITLHQLGKGKALLSAVHFESLPSERLKALYRNGNKSFAYDEKILKNLLPHEEALKEAQKDLYETLLN